MKRAAIILTLTAINLGAAAQSVVSTEAELKAIFKADANMGGSVYRAYPTPVHPAASKAPKGYSVAYISHYGRHGSRWLPEDMRYENVLKIFDSNQLTPLGKDVRRKLEIIWQDAKGCGGDLTRVGERQHNQIAHRMAKNFPALFQGNNEIHAVSSTVRRCMMSMTAFCEGLKESNPLLNISKEAHERTMSYINYESPELKKRNAKDSEWNKKYQEYQANTLNPSRLMASLFINPESISRPLHLMEELYWLAEDMQNTTLNPSEVNLLTLFTPDELYAQWRCINYRMYMAHSNAVSANHIPANSANSLLDDIIAKADKALNGESHCTVDLRFGHDSALLRLLARMGISGADASIADVSQIPLAWQDFRISPMAANLQIVFYHNQKGSVLVRFLLNENPVHLSAPLTPLNDYYYDWSEVKELWRK